MTTTRAAGFGRPFIAVHEAAHAVVARHLGFEVLDVWVEEDCGGCTIKSEPGAAVLLGAWRRPSSLGLTTASSSASAWRTASVRRSSSDFRFTTAM